MLKNYNAGNLILIAAYILGSLILLKSKLHANFRTHQDAKPANYLLPFSAFTLISALAACVFFTLIPLKQIKNTGVFFNELLDEEEAPGGDEELFILQDKIQEELTLAVFQLAETEQKHKALNSFGLLIQDSPNALSAANAEESLLSILSNPDSGLNKISRQELSALIRKYMSKKIPHQMGRIKENLAGTLQNAGINLGKRFRILKEINNMQQSNSFLELNKNSHALQKDFEKSSLSSGSKKQLKDDTAELRAWRLYQLYRKRLADISEEIDIYTGEKKEELKELINKINNMERSSDAQTIDKKISLFKEKTLPAEKNTALGIEELLSLKLDITAIKERKKLEEKLRFAGVPEQVLRDLENENEQLEKSDELKQMAKAKIAALIKKIQKEIEELIDKSNPREAGKEFLQELAMMEFSQDSRQVNNSSGKLLDLADRLYGQNRLQKESRDAIAENINDLAQLLNMKLYSNTIPQKEILSKLPEHQNIKSAPAAIKIALQKGWLLGLLARILIALFLLLATLILLFFFLTEKERLRIAARRANRKEFIIALYENLIKVLEISGLKHYNYTPHLSYAASVTEKYIITGGLFRKFTERFEKAKYSTHEPEIGEDAAALSEYNAFLRILFSRQNKRSLFYFYFRSLIKKVPVIILTLSSQ